VTKRVLFLLLFFCPFFLHPFAIAKSDAVSASRPPLIPQPREFENRPDVRLAGGVWISASHADRDDAFAAKDLTDALAERGVREKASPSATHIYLLHDSEIAAKRILQHEGISLDEAAQPEGYVLVTGARAVYVIAHSSTGIFYGVQTMKQLVTQVGGESVLRGCKVRDWPAMRYRGVHDDLSRGPVPTLEFQKKQIRTFAAYKLNVYSPYFEHTMQYASNPLAGLPGGSMTREEAKELVAYAAQYHVMIVPEQEAFGHLHHVLTWQQYAPLAEVQSGSVLEGVRGHHAIIMVRRCNQGRRIPCAGFDVMYRRVSIKRLKLFWIITRAVVCNPVPADGEFVEAQHVHYACLLHDGLVQIRPLIRRRTDEQASV